MLEQHTRITQHTILYPHRQVGRVFSYRCPRCRLPQENMLLAQINHGFSFVHLQTKSISLSLTTVAAAQIRTSLHSLAKNEESAGKWTDYSLLHLPTLSLLPSSLMVIFATIIFLSRVFFEVWNGALKRTTPADRIYDVQIQIITIDVKFIAVNQSSSYGFFATRHLHLS